MNETLTSPETASGLPVPSTPLFADSPGEWTHKALVRRMASWLKFTKLNTVVIAELATRNSETPDVIAWRDGAKSILIECKISRADFRADGGKWFRRHEEDGMGDLRYVAAPIGLLCADEMPERWGLLEVTKRQVRVTKEAEPMKAHKGRECVMLMSALRRVELSTAVYVVADEQSTANNMLTGSGGRKETP
jgi:hypothetical protein